MYFLQMTVDSVAWVREISFALSLLICGLFLLEYKRFSAAIEKEEMLDGFLNPLGRHILAEGESGPSPSDTERGEDGRLSVL
ncbi:MAG: hypothetical protein V4676_13245 [Bacteroidota bacterium]